MPWEPSDATKHTKKANTAKKKRQWADVANSALASGDSEASAIRQANAAVAGTAQTGTAQKSASAKKAKDYIKTRKKARKG